MEVLEFGAGPDDFCNDYWVDASAESPNPPDRDSKGLGGSELGMLGLRARFACQTTVGPR